MKVPFDPEGFCRRYLSATGQVRRLRQSRCCSNPGSRGCSLDDPPVAARSCWQAAEPHKWAILNISHKTAILYLQNLHAVDGGPGRPQYSNICCSCCRACGGEISKIAGTDEYPSVKRPSSLGEGRNSYNEHRYAGSDKIRGSAERPGPISRAAKTINNTEPSSAPCINVRYRTWPDILFAPERRFARLPGNRNRIQGIQANRCRIHCLVALRNVSAY